MTLIRISSNYFVAGIDVGKLGRIMKAAPILKYMIGWTVPEVQAYCKHKRWKLEMIE